VFSGVPIQAQEISLEQDLVARYLFEGNARNEVEDRNHGIETNVHYTPDRHGQGNQALYLTGDNSFVTIPHTEDLNWDARSESYSIAFWFKSSDPNKDGDDPVRLITKWDEYLTTPYPFLFGATQEFIVSAIFDTNKPNLRIQVNGIWDDQWHHLVMVYDHSLQQMSCYLDNQLVESTPHNFIESSRNTEDILIGKLPVFNYYYQGYADDLYFYNRAIHPCEVEALYSGQLLQER
jgi:hypothetical protein